MQTKKLMLECMADCLMSCAQYFRKSRFIWFSRRRRTREILNMTARTILQGNVFATRLLFRQ